MIRVGGRSLVSDDCRCGSVVGFSCCSCNVCPVVAVSSVDGGGLFFPVFFLLYCGTVAVCPPSPVVGCSA
eukprot:12920701-Prorocentrum_lima.AAC.1